MKFINNNKYLIVFIPCFLAYILSKSIVEEDYIDPDFPDNSTGIGKQLDYPKIEVEKLSENTHIKQNTKNDCLISKENTVINSGESDELYEWKTKVIDEADKVLNIVKDKNLKNLTIILPEPEENNLNIDKTKDQIPETKSSEYYKSMFPTIDDNNNNDNKKPILSEDGKQRLDKLAELLTTDKSDPKFITLQEELNNLGINITSPEKGFSPEVDALLLEYSPLKTGKKNYIREWISDANKADLISPDNISKDTYSYSSEKYDKDKLNNETTVKDSTSASSISENKPKCFPNPNLNIDDENKPKPFPEWTVHDERRPSDTIEGDKWDHDYKMKKIWAERVANMADLERYPLPVVDKGIDKSTQTEKDKEPLDFETKSEFLPIMDKITRVEENLTAIDEIIGDERIRDSVRENLLKEK